MSNVKHTNGPWSYADIEYGHYAIYGADGRLIAHVFGDDAKAQEDARLIAAAPELLEALQDMLHVWEHGSVATYPIGKVRAAIAKATGDRP